jgi:16S rRNA processing protein RimM
MSDRTVVHLVRHGEVYNPTKVLYGRLPGFRLSDDGRQMARDAAEALRGRDVEVAASDALRLPRGQFYWHQVIGLRVESSTGEALGTVADILETGANDVYIVRGPRGEILLPAIKEVIKRIDPQAGRMLVELVPGLLRDA